MMPSVVDMVRFSNNLLAYSSPILNYYVGYDTGFGGRKLIGTICSLFLPDYVEMRHMRPIIVGANLLMLGLFYVLSCVVLSRSGKGTIALALLLTAYLVSPFSILRWCSSGLSVCFMETYMLILTLAWLPLYLNCRRRWYYYLATLAIAVVGCLIHHTFCCTFFPLFVALFVYDSLEGGRIVLSRVACYAGICLIELLVLVAIWQFSHMNVGLDELYARVMSRTSPEVCGRDTWTFQFYYYMSNAENRRLAFADATGLYRQLVVSLALLLPIFSVFYVPLAIAARRASTAAARWGYGLVMASVTLFTLPIFFMATDYSRWWMAWFFCLFALLMVMCHRGDTLVSGIVRHPVFQLAMLAVVIFETQLHMNEYVGLQEANTLIHHIFHH